jgi:hypothetical protein
MQIGVPAATFAESTARMKVIAESGASALTRRISSASAPRLPRCRGMTGAAHNQTYRRSGWAIRPRVRLTTEVAGFGCA